VLHLAPRSVRDLIYAGRLPSVRIGRLHYVRASDLELERRRRLGLPPAAGRARRPRVLASRPASGARVRERPREHIDPALRRQRAAERASIVRAWAERHMPSAPNVPFEVESVAEPVTCAACGRQVRRGRMVRAEGDRLCVTCGRRALLTWADRRRLEAAAARRLSQELGAIEPSPATDVA
jgi:hypothetical protein